MTQILLFALVTVAAVAAPLVLWRLAVRRHRASRLWAPRVDPRTLPEPIAPHPFDGFGRKTQWLAFRSDSPRDVVRALGLKDVQRAHWSDGAHEANAPSAGGSAVFVSPPIEGWVLVVSAGMAGLPENLPLLKVWSRTLATEVQQFGSHRVVGYLAWARVRAGRVLRAYAYLGERGETLVDEGQRAPEEPGSQTMDEIPEEDVPALIASHWSLNPLTLREAAERVGPGWSARW